MDFKQADAQFKALKARFEAGNLSEEDFKTELQNLMIQDDQGRWWMIGYETEQWYRHDGINWVQADPPGISPSRGTVLAAAPTPPKADDKPGSSDPGPQGAGRPGQKSGGGLPLAALGAGGLILLLIGGFFAYRFLAPAPTEGANRAPLTAIPVSGGQLQDAATLTPSPSAVPSQTITATPEIHIFSAVSKIYFYDGPGLNYKMGGENPEGTEFLVIARDPSGLWFLTQAPDGTQGWLYKDWIFAESDLSIVPIASSIPTALPTPTKKKKEAPPTKPVPPTKAPTACYMYCY